MKRSARALPLFSLVIVLEQIHPAEITHAKTFEFKSCSTGRTTSQGPTCRSL